MINNKATWRLFMIISVLATVAVELPIPGKRKKGRPTEIWKDSVKKDTELMGLKGEDGKDRNNWRRLVQPRLTPSGNTAIEE